MEMLILAGLILLNGLFAMSEIALVTARKASTWSYVRPSPITPTVRTGSSTANACQIAS